MEIYLYIAVVIFAVRALFLISAWKNYHYAVSKYTRQRNYQPPAALIVPCKGLDRSFQENIRSFFQQDYDNHRLYFVVQDQADPAYEALCQIKREFAESSQARDVQILVAGQTGASSQKIHNLLFAFGKIAADIQVIAFADSDACAGTNWLRHLIYPLRKSKNGASTGYRWFVPEKNNLPTLALSAVNAKVAQLMGNTRFNHAWGGSMAIRTETFKNLGIDKTWQKTLSDDLTLSMAVRKAKLKVAFVPACLVASYDKTSWAKLWEFARRQFIITRVNAPGTWLFALLSATFAALVPWITAGLAVYAYKINHPQAMFYLAVPIFFFASQFIRAVFRQLTAVKILHKELPKMKPAIAADLLLFWLFNFLLMTIIISSAIGRTITWRNIKYKLVSPTETIVISQ